MKKDYVIFAPKYSISNGTRVLYRLAEELKLRGYNAYVYAIPSDVKDVEYIDEINDEMRKNAIIIYPEIVTGNPLQFQNVVRYVLYYPGKLGGESSYDEYELPFVFDRKYFSQGDVLTIPSLDKSIFYKDDTKKDVDCYFVYKGGKWKEIKEFDNMIEINGCYPATRKELGDLLRRTKTLYSYDSHSQLLAEAKECGCNVKIVTEDGFEDYLGNYDEYIKDFEKQIDNFVEKTQKMNYQGEIRSLTSKQRKDILKYKFKYHYYSKLLHNKSRAQKALYNSKCYIKG